MRNPSPDSVDAVQIPTFKYDRRQHMFGLIGHSTSFEAARRKALELGFDHIVREPLSASLVSVHSRRNHTSLAGL